MTQTGERTWGNITPDQVLIMLKSEMRTNRAITNAVPGTIILTTTAKRIIFLPTKSIWDKA